MNRLTLLAPLALVAAAGVPVQAAAEAPAAEQILGIASERETAAFHESHGSGTR